MNTGGPAIPGDLADAGRIDGWPDFLDRVRAGMAVAAAQPSSLCLADSDFARWPLGERSVMEAFLQWALGSRATTCTLIANSLDQLPRRHARWLDWRDTWAHRAQCRQPRPEDEGLVVPTLWLLQGQLGLRLLDPVVGRGLWTRQESALQQWQQEFDVISQRCSEGLPPTTLGL